MRGEIEQTGQNGIGTDESIAKYLSQAYGLIDILDSRTGTLGITANNLSNDISDFRRQLTDITNRLSALEKS